MAAGRSVFIQLVDAVVMNTILELAAAGERKTIDVSETHVVEKAAVPPARASKRAQLTLVGSICPVR